MSTTYSTTGLAQTTASTPRVSSAFKNFGVRFKNGANGSGCEADLCNLSDRELMDIGITRGEIDYVASNRDTDPRRHPIRGMNVCCLVPAGANFGLRAMAHKRPVEAQLSARYWPPTWLAYSRLIDA